ncbi:MAG: RsmE family RNA methyltransferase [Ferruginibacter sp.]|nr:RsmE family RNA methyltransferase [Ferruginibacter sp.]
MALPFFYTEEALLSTGNMVLNEETSKHVAQVLRMQIGASLQLTDGKGRLMTATIIDNNKKKCLVQPAGEIIETKQPVQNTIAISLVKNAHRFEWFLEKATEIGIAKIIPLLCTRTEKQHFRFDRMQGILVSAMLQSQQCWLPALEEPLRFNEFIKRDIKEQKFIAHCEEDERNPLRFHLKKDTGSLVCIGPEGDFTVDEIYNATRTGFLPVSLGDTRLRTETAGIVAATLLMIQ